MIFDPKIGPCDGDDSTKAIASAHFGMRVCGGNEGGYIQYLFSWSLSNAHSCQFSRHRQLTPEMC